MSQTLSFDVEDPGDSPTYFFEGDGAEDNETLPVDVNYRFLAPSGWDIVSANTSSGTIDVYWTSTDVPIAELMQSAGEPLPDLTCPGWNSRGRHVRKKIEALECYASQKHNPYFDAEFFRSVVRMRGIHLAAVYAEGFETLKVRLDGML